MAKDPKTRPIDPRKPVKPAPMPGKPPNGKPK
jgi:hypothetical protein